jgi:hypothetical protein
VSIPFTQFLRPNGRKTVITIVRPDAIEADAAQLMAAGARFEIEVLRTGHVSIEIVADNKCDPDEPHSLAMALVPNGPLVPTAIDEAVLNAKGEAIRLGLIT